MAYSKQTELGVAGGQASGDGRRLPRSRAAFGRRMLPVLFVVVLVVIWELYCLLEGVQEYVLPAPSVIFARIQESWPALYDNGLATLKSTVVGFVVGSAVGFALAGIMFFSRLVRDIVYPLVVGAQTIPKVALAPLLVLWFGFGVTPRIAIVALMCFFPVTITSLEGLDSPDRNLLDLLRSVNASRFQIFTRIRLPNAWPQVLSGLKIAMTLAVVGAVVAEWVGSDAGLGYLLLLANSQLDAPLLFSALFLLILMGVALYELVAVAEWWLLRWQRV